MIESLNEFDTPAEEFVIADSLLGPADQSTIQANTLNPAEFLVERCMGCHCFQSIWQIDRFAAGNSPESSKAILDIKLVHKDRIT